jgi:hypothetical protein
MGEMPVSEAKRLLLKIASVMGYSVACDECYDFVARTVHRLRYARTMRCAFQTPSARLTMQDQHSCIILISDNKRYVFAISRHQ